MSKKDMLGTMTFSLIKVTKLTDEEKTALFAHPYAKRFCAWENRFLRSREGYEWQMAGIYSHKSLKRYLTIIHKRTGRKSYDWEVSRMKDLMGDSTTVDLNNFIGKRIFDLMTEKYGEDCDTCRLFPITAEMRKIFKACGVQDLNCDKNSVVCIKFGSFYDECHEIMDIWR